jgi:hypothetical protein
VSFLNVFIKVPFGMLFVFLNWTVMHRNMHSFVASCMRILLLLLLCHCLFFNILTFSFYISKELNSEADAQANLAVSLAGEALVVYLAFLAPNFILIYSLILV